MHTIIYIAHSLARCCIIIVLSYVIVPTCGIEFLLFNATVTMTVHKILKAKLILLLFWLHSSFIVVLYKLMC